jgi:thiol-disulfide isomerase/thioredoxin
MMKKGLLLLLSIAFLCNAKAQTKTKKSSPPANTPKAVAGHNISITLTPYKNTKIYLGSYYVKGQTLVDSTLLDDKSHGVFKGEKKYTGGIYFIVSPQMSIQFELLMDDNQHFSIVADSSKKELAVITGSKDNDLFKEYTKLTTVKGKYLSDVNGRLANAKTAADSATLRDELIKGEKELQDYRDNIIGKYPESLLAMLFSVMKTPELPKVPVVNGKPDSLYPYYFVKNHYWDGVNFFDDRLLRTPFFEKKLEQFYKYYVSPEPDSIYREIKRMLLYAKAGNEIYPYLLIKFTNKYVNPEYMGQDKVFLKLYEDFYATGDTSLLSPPGRKMVVEKYFTLLPNQVGEAAAPLTRLTDSAGVPKPLYDVDAKFTVMIFWDPHCGHCKEEIPRYDSIYKAKWKALGVKVYAVYVYDDNLPDWKKFIQEKKLNDWIHVYQTKASKEDEQRNNIPGFRQLYDAGVTPTIFLLDDKKRIIAKKLTIEQFDGVIASRLKKKD